MAYRVIMFCMLLLPLCAQAQLNEEQARRLTVTEQAQELLRSNKPAEALQVLSSSRIPSEASAAYHAHYARALVQLGRTYESIEHFRLAFLYAADPAEQEKLLFERASAYQQLGFFAEAALCYDMFLKTFPRSADAPRARLAIAEAKYRQRSYREAARLFEQLGPSVAARAGRANSLQALGRTGEAHGIYRSLVETEFRFINESQETLYNMGVNFLQMGKPADAAIYLNSVKADAFAPRAAVHLGRIYLKEKKYDEALKHIADAERSNDRAVASEALMLKAETLLQQDREQDADSVLRQLREQYPYGAVYDEASLRLARMERKRGRSNEAAELLKELVYRRRPEPEAISELEGLMLDAKQRGPEQLERLWQSMGRWLLSPTRSEVLLQVSRGLRTSGKPFIDLCTWIVRYGTPEGRNECSIQLADFYAGLGDAARANGYLLRYRGPRTDALNRVHAKMSLAKGETAAAAGQTMAIRRPNSEDALLVLDALKAGAVPAKKALPFCERVLSGDAPAPFAALQLADVLSQQGEPQRALAWYRTAASARPVAGGRELTEGEREWAQYRIVSLTKGAGAAEALAALEKGKGQAAKIAAADLRGRALRERMP